MKYHSARVKLGNAGSDLVIGAGCRHQLDEVLRGASQVVAISDSHVHKALKDRMNWEAHWLTIEPGEASKSFPQVARLWSEMAALKADRQTAVVAVGGGVVGDLAGFVAATYMRGVSFYSLPTSLLAMVDASVGGKVGIDLPEGKNLAGAFYPARTVAVDPELLETLPGREWAAGMSEVIKHAILSGESLWSTVCAFSWEKAEQIEVLDHLLYSAIKVKVDVVEQDPYERTGLRATLNLGHTYAHALEHCSNYGLSHGEAVALGLLAGLRLSRLLGRLVNDFEAQLLGCLSHWSLPTTLPDPEAAHWNWEAMQRAFDRDKKNRDGRWVFILPRDMGRVETVEAPDADLVREAFESLKREVSL